MDVSSFISLYGSHGRLFFSPIFFILVTDFVGCVILYSSFLQYFTCIVTNIFLYFALFHPKWSASTWYPWAVYAAVIFITFSAIKVINLQLHLMFDTSESIEEEPRSVKNHRADTHQTR